MLKLRIRYRRSEAVRFISHLDIQRALRRALARAGISVAYTEGFSPRPKIGMGVPLSVGHLSEAEYADVAVAKPIAPERFASRLNAALPEGLRVTWAGRLPPGTPTVSAATAEIEYRADVPWSAIPQDSRDEQELGRALDSFRHVDKLVIERERKGKVQRFDLKQQVPMLELKRRSEGVEVTMRIALRQSGFPKPEEVLCAVFSLDERSVKNALIIRTDVGFASTSRMRKSTGDGRHES